MKKNKVNYGVGDTVIVDLFTAGILLDGNLVHSKKTFTSVVKEIRERIGRSPLVYFENGEVCDAGYITEVVRRKENPSL